MDDRELDHIQNHRHTGVIGSSDVEAVVRAFAQVIVLFAGIQNGVPYFGAPPGKEPTPRYPPRTASMLCGTPSDQAWVAL